MASKTIHCKNCNQIFSSQVRKLKNGRNSYGKFCKKLCKEKFNEPKINHLIKIISND